MNNNSKCLKSIKLYKENPTVALFRIILHSLDLTQQTAGLTSQKSVSRLVLAQFGIMEYNLFSCVLVTTQPNGMLISGLGIYSVLWSFDKNVLVAADSAGLIAKALEINILRNVRTGKMIPEKENMRYDELDLSPGVLKGLKKMGYEQLTAVQEQTFHYILSGRDMIARAETGSGKTAACAVPMVQAVDTSLKAVQGLVVVPTRELALQYVSEIAGIAKETKVQPFAVYGGFSIQIQKSKLNHGVHILVATPGRLIDLLYNTPLSLSEVRTFVLDEADEMLNMGFIDDVEFIINCLVHDHQTLLFSATMPQAIKDLAAKYLKDPLTIELNVDKIAPQSLLHHFNQVRQGRREEALLEYLEDEKPTQVIIFCNSRSNVEKLFGHLRRTIDSVEVIHGGLEQSRRTSLFNRFRGKKIRMMVATDVASRGLDFSHVSHVINYDFPNSCEAYTHRTGRTARMGRKGSAMTFFTSRDLRNLGEVIKVNHIKPIWLGEEPDFSKAPKKRPGGRYQGRNGRRGGGGRRRRA